MKGSNDINVQDLFSLIARHNEVVKRVRNGELDINDALAGTQGILDKTLSPRREINRFTEYTELLYPIARQAECLRSLNEQMPKDMRVPTTWFTQLDTNSDHVQSVQDLEFFFVVPAVSLKKVIKYQVGLIELTQPGIWRSQLFDGEIDGAYLDDTADKLMFTRPGIYRRRINLVSYWNPKKDSSVDLVRDQATSSGILLAGLAAIGAYAAQDLALYQSQDGVNLPYFDIAELRSGDGGFHAFCSCWDCNDRKVIFNSYRSDFIDRRHYAAPSFVWGAY